MVRCSLRTDLPASQVDKHLDRDAGTKRGTKEVDDGIWLASFTAYDLGYIDLEEKTLHPIDNPFGTRVSPMS